MDAVIRRVFGIVVPQYRAKCPKCGRSIVASRHRDKETGVTMWRMRPHSWHRNGGAPCDQRVVDALLVNDTELRQARADAETSAAYQRWADA